MAGDTCFRTTSISVAIEDIRIDDIIWGVNIEEREVKQRRTLRAPTLKA